jgi:hypothetical protein
VKDHGREKDCRLLITQTARIQGCSTDLWAGRPLHRQSRRAFLDHRCARLSKFRLTAAIAPRGYRCGLAPGSAATWRVWQRGSEKVADTLLLASAGGVVLCRSITGDRSFEIRNVTVTPWFDLECCPRSLLRGRNAALEWTRRRCCSSNARLGTPRGGGCGRLFVVVSHYASDARRVLTFSRPVYKAYAAYRVKEKYTADICFCLAPNSHFPCPCQSAMHPTGRSPKG